MSERVSCWGTERAVAVIQSSLGGVRVIETWRHHGYMGDQQRLKPQNIALQKLACLSCCD